MYTYNIRSVVGVYTPVGVVTEWLWSVHSKLECTLRQGKGWHTMHSVVTPKTHGLKCIDSSTYLPHIRSEVHVSRCLTHFSM